MKKLMILIVPLLFISCSPIKADTAVISFTGDIIMHIPVKRCVINHNVIDTSTKKSLNNQGFDYLFQEITKEISADISVGNMEFPVSPPFESKPFIFNCTPEVLPAMKKAGFTVMHIGNNHILDQAYTGVVNTINYIKKSGLSYIGAGINEQDARNGFFFEKNGIKIGILGYTGILNYNLPKVQKGFYVNWLYEKEKVLEDIAAMKKKCDYLIMVAHYGKEYDLAPSEKDRNLLKEYINSGVNLVIGHHPHLVQPVEKIMAADNREAYIFHSLGNFLSNQTSTSIPGNEESLSTRDTIIVRLKLEKTGKGIKQDFVVIPAITRNEFNQTDQKHEIQTVTILSEIEKKRKQLSAKKDDRTMKEITYLKNRLLIIEKALFNGNKFQNIKYINQ